METFGFEEMQKIQHELQEKYKDKWPQLSPRQGRSTLLWMMSEAGEIADIIKKKGDESIMMDPVVRQHFVEEMCDVMMYFNDLMICYNISAEEIERVYRAKHRRNMERW